VPLPFGGDRRAWDALISIDIVRSGVDAETHVRDPQAQERRLALKRRDGGVDHVILLLSDMRHHRGLLAVHGRRLVEAFPVAGRACLRDLAVPRDPGGSAIVLL
jgi:hypothetical protein